MSDQSSNHNPQRQYTAPNSDSQTGPLPNADNAEPDTPLIVGGNANKTPAGPSDNAVPDAGIQDSAGPLSPHSRTGSCSVRGALSPSDPSLLTYSARDLPASCNTQTFPPLVVPSDGGNQTNTAWTTVTFTWNVADVNRLPLPKHSQDGLPEQDAPSPDNNDQTGTSAQGDTP